METNFVLSSNLFSKIHFTLENDDSNIYSELDELFRNIELNNGNFSLIYLVTMMKNSDEKRCYEIIKFAINNYSFFLYDEIDVIAILDRFNDEEIKYSLFRLLVIDNKHFSEKGISKFSLFNINNSFTNSDIKLSITMDLINNKLIYVDSSNVANIISSVDNSKKFDLIKFLIDMDFDNSIFDSNALKDILLSCKGPYFMNIFKLLLDRYDFSSHNEKEFFVELLNVFDSDIIFNILDYYFSFKHIKEAEFDNTFSLLDYIIEYYNYINDDDDYDYPNDVSNMPRIIQMYADKYKLNIEHLEYFIKNFTARTFIFLKSSNFRNIINLEDKDFYRIINLFSNITLDNDTLNSIVNSVLQYKFSLDGKYNNLFEKLVLLISDNNNQDNLNAFNAIFLDISLQIDIISILEKYGYTTDSYLDAIAIGKKNVRNILHEITDAFIAKKREEYYSENTADFYDHLNLKVKFKKSSFKKLIVNRFSSNTIIGIINKIPADLLNSSMKTLLDNKLLLIKIINLKKGIISIDTFDQEEKKYLRVFESMLNLIYDIGLYKTQLYNFNNLSDYADSSNYEYYAPATSTSHLLDIISLLDKDAILRYLNDSSYDLLLDLFNKYKLINASQVFTPISNDIDLLFDANSLAAIINFLPEILADVKDYKKITFTQLFSYGNLYSSVSNKYKLILGDIDYNFLAMNSGQYKAPLSKCVRLDRAISLLSKMYKKKYLSIPSFIKEYRCDSNNIRAVVGNATSTINLTLGERTDACLRIGGICNDLHKFALTNPNGFNVCFYDNKNKLISRVTGIRYGNTVVFNQLRDSLNDDFKPMDLYMAIKGVSDDLIKMSADGNNPIENIIITKDKALHNLNIPSSNDLYINDFSLINYCSSFGIFLDDSNSLLLSGDTLKPIRNYTITDSYKTVDSSVVEYIGKEADKKVSQMHAINDLLNGSELKDIVPVNTKYERILATDTFYVGMNSNNDIVCFVLDEFKDDNDVLDKMDECIKKFDRKVKSR